MGLRIVLDVVDLYNVQHFIRCGILLYGVAQSTRSAVILVAHKLIRGVRSNRHGGSCANPAGRRLHFVSRVRCRLGLCLCQRVAVEVLNLSADAVGLRIVLDVVQVDHVGRSVSADGQSLGIGMVEGIAGNGDHFVAAVDHGLEGLTVLGLGGGQDLVGILIQVVHRVAQIVPDGPGACEGYVLVGHGEGAVGHGGVGGIPTVEGVAGKGGLICHGHGGTVGVGLRGGGRGGSGGGCTGVGIGHLEVHLLPDSIERIVARVTHDDGIAGLIFRGSRGGVLAPAQEGIAGAGEAKGRVALQQDGLVILIAAGHGRAAAAVGVIGQSSGAGLIAPDGVEGDVGVMDGNLVAGLIDGAAAFLGTPTQEHLALGGGQLGSAHDIRVGTVGIGLVVHRYGAGAVGGIIGDGEGLVAGVVGIEGNIAVNQGVEVEGGVDVVGISSAPHSPASPGVAIGNGDRGEVILIDLGAVGDGNFLRFAAFHGQIGSALKLRRGPLGVKHQVAAGHGSAGPVELGACRAALGGVPAGEHIGLVNSGGSVRRVVLTADIRFEVDILNDFLVVAVDEGQVILLTGVVEVYIVVTVTTLVFVLRFTLVVEASQSLLTPGCTLIIGYNLV